MKLWQGTLWCNVMSNPLTKEPKYKLINPFIYVYRHRLYWKQTYRHIVYIHIYSWDKAVHPPALPWENTKPLLSSIWQLPPFKNYADVSCVVTICHLVSVAVNLNESCTCYTFWINEMKSYKLAAVPFCCMTWKCGAWGLCRRELLFHREVTGVFQVLIVTIMTFCHDCEYQIKHKTLAQIPVQNKKRVFKNVFKKSHPFTKGSVGAMHANIKSSDDSASHHSQRQIYTCITRTIH